MKGWSMECSNHTYISLFYNDKFVHCYDNDHHSYEPKNDGYYAENIIENIEKRTGMKITDIPIKGTVEDFDGMRFKSGGYKKGHEWLNKNQEQFQKGDAI